jgi:hypothetical protein
MRRSVFIDLRSRLETEFQKLVARFDNNKRDSSRETGAQNDGAWDLLMRVSVS